MAHRKIVPFFFAWNLIQSNYNSSYQSNREANSFGRHLKGGKNDVAM